MEHSNRKRKSGSIKLITTFILLTVCPILFSCHPRHHDEPNNGNGYGFHGAIYFGSINDPLTRLDLNTGKKSTLIQCKTNMVWNVTQNGESLIVAALNMGYGDIDFTISNINNGMIVSKFKYTPPSSELLTGGVYPSPDNSMIALSSSYSVGIAIFNIQGKRIYYLLGIGNQKFNQKTELAWMPNNTLLIKMGNKIYRSNANFTQYFLVKTLNFQSCGNIAVRPDGKKIAFNADNHIWMMNSDGSDLKQITNSSNKERCGCFSPDGRYLLIGPNWIPDAYDPGTWELAIIPADGTVHNVDKGADPKVVYIKNKNYSDGVEIVNLPMVWRQR